jgi:hypothetical protein
VLFFAVFALGAPPALAADPPGGAGWSANAVQYRGQNGVRYVYTCPNYGTVGSGVKVTIEMRPGEISYKASTRRGIRTRDYPGWPGSFVVIGGLDGPDTFNGIATGTATVRGANWQTTDRCDVNRKTPVIVKAGKSYLAKAP